MNDKKVVIVNGVSIEIDVTAYVKWENRAAKSGKTVAQEMSDFINHTD